jgi:hypothetical protein
MLYASFNSINFQRFAVVYFLCTTARCFFYVLLVYLSVVYAFNDISITYKIEQMKQ